MKWTPQNLQVIARARLKFCVLQDCHHKGPQGCTLKYIVMDGGRCISYGKGVTSKHAD